MDNLTVHIDDLPTLCEVAGAKIPDTLRPAIEGFSLVPRLEAKGLIGWHDDRDLAWSKPILDQAKKQKGEQTRENLWRPYGVLQ